MAEKVRVDNLAIYLEGTQFAPELYSGGFTALDDPETLIREARISYETENYGYEKLPAIQFGHPSFAMGLRDALAVEASMRRRVA